MINLLILLLVNCSNYVASSISNRANIQIKLLVDKNEILANGLDYCSFEVKDKDGNDLFADIYMDNEKISNKKFSTFKQGTYSFIAIYNNIKSNSLKVNAIEVSKEFPLKEEDENVRSINDEIDIESLSEESKEVEEKYKELEIYEILSKGQAEEISIEILDELEIDKPIKEMNGMNLLSYALVNTKNFDFLIKVFNIKKDLNFKAQDENGNTFLHFLVITIPSEEDKSFQNKWKELLNTFKEVTSEYFTELLCIKNKEGLNPFQIAIYLKDIQRFEILIKNVNISSFFLEKDDKGNTISHYLVEVMENASEFTEFLNLLSSSKGFNLNYLSYKNNEGNSALTKAILLKKYEIAKVLAKRKNHRNEYIKLSIDYIKEKCKVDDRYIDELLE